MQQLALTLSQSLTEATAEQLAWQRGRDFANDADDKQAALMVAQWNKTRMALGLKPFDDDFEPPEPKVTIVEVLEDE